MARFLICSMPLVGHVTPGLPIARALVARGHEVCWYTGQRFQGAVEVTGARYLPMEAARDFDDRDMDAAFPGTVERTGLAAFKFDVKHIFFDAAQGQIADLQRILQTFPADVILSDTAFVGAGMLHEMGGPMWATYGMSALTLNSRDTAPFGLALPPSASPLGRIRNRMLAMLFGHVLFRDVAEYLRNIRCELGLSRNGPGALNATLSPYLYLQGSAPSFEYPRSDLPPQVHFVGPLLQDAPASFTPPIWWDDLQGSKPVVLVTQGTVSTQATDLLRPTLHALANEDVLVVATTGGLPIDETMLDALLVEDNVPLLMPSSHMLMTSGALISFSSYTNAQLGPPQRREMPSNVRLEPFIPFTHLMPHVDVMITNGGFGGVQLALSHGVPLVVAGATQEKPEIAARVAWSGAGINLKTRTPSPNQIRAAVRTVLAQKSYRHNAERIQADYKQHNTPVESAVLLEQLARSRQPVLRGDALPIEQPREAQLATSG